VNFCQLRYGLILILLSLLTSTCGVPRSVRESIPLAPQPVIAVDQLASSSKPHIAAVNPVFPFYFEENRGQVDASVKYLARGRGYTVFLSPNETVLALQRPETQTQERLGDWAHGRLGDMTWHSHVPSQSLLAFPYSAIRIPQSAMPAAPPHPCKGLNLS